MTEDKKEELDSSSDEECNLGAPVCAKQAAPNKFEETASAGYESLAKQEDKLLGERITIVFKLPSGEKLSQQFRMGHSVEWLKQALEDKAGLKYQNTRLLFGGKMMLDPLSLSDVRGLKPNSENEVDVTVV
eukprot:RCo022804